VTLEKDRYAEFKREVLLGCEVVERSGFLSKNLVELEQQIEEEKV